VSFAEKYPQLTAWVSEAGSIEIGYLYDVPDPSFLRIIHYTEVIWCSDKPYASLEEALAEMETAIISWCAEQGITLGQG
jgi:hypothetical protein